MFAVMIKDAKGETLLEGTTEIEGFGFSRKEVEERIDSMKYTLRGYGREYRIVKITPITPYEE